MSKLNQDYYYGSAGSLLNISSFALEALCVPVNLEVALDKYVSFPVVS